MALSLSMIMTLIIVGLAPFLLFVFTPHLKNVRLRIPEIPKEIWRQGYLVHIFTYFAMTWFKAVIDSVNEPLKSTAGDYTGWIYVIEGNAVYWIQRVFEHPALTSTLNFHYLFIYLFIIAFTPAYFAFVRERDLTDKATMNYIMIYVLAVPAYLFFNVEVTSSYIAGMHALLYHSNAQFYEFFTSHDPLDNAVPSLHIAIPMGLLFLNWLHIKERGIRMQDWEHRGIHYFVAANTGLFMFSILYLGIHWITDIFLGTALALIGAMFVHTLQPRLRAWIHRPHTLPSPRRIASALSSQVIAVGLLVVLLLTAIDAKQGDPIERPNYRLGPQDVNLDIFEPIDMGDSIDIRITNLHPELVVHGILADRVETLEAIEGGRINWTWLEERFPVQHLEANQTTRLKVSEADTWHVLVLHNPAPMPTGFEDDAAGERDAVENATATIHVQAVYPGDVLPVAVIFSVPSLWATAYVIRRQLRLVEQGRRWFDSGPLMK